LPVGKVEQEGGPVAYVTGLLDFEAGRTRWDGAQLSLFQGAEIRHVCPPCKFPCLMMSNLTSLIMSGTTRPISWIKSARKAFDGFPEMVQLEGLRALTIAAEGQKADTAKPMQGLGAGVMEIALRHRGDAWRVIYALQIGSDIWVIHAFQKKSKSGITTSKQEIDLIKERIRRLQEILR